MKEKNRYDIIIVGAGPAGLFACLELIDKKFKGSVLLVDMGNRIAKRKPNEVMSGFGGAGTYSDGKLHFTPKLSHERCFHLISPDNYQKILDKIEKTFAGWGVDSIFYPRNEEETRLLKEEAEREDIELIVRRSQHTGTDKLKEIMVNLEAFLTEKGIDFRDKTKVVDLIVKNGQGIGVIDKKGNKYFGKKILLAPGRVSASWLQKLATKHGIKYQYGMVEVGVRIEFPKSVMKRYADALYEIVLKMRTKTYDDIMRTFCTCPNGLVAMEDYRGMVCVNGHSTSEHAAENSNFAFVCEVNLTEPVENSIAYAESIAKLATTIGGGKPILQMLADLRKGRRSTWDRLKKSLVKPSLTDVTPGDISMALPHRIVTNILEGLEKLDKVMPGINSGSTLLYAPEVKLDHRKLKPKKPWKLI
ncbi:FAD-dependent oxidoreductase [Candidatus Shapirobacteria bacterium]|nr:MAG: FAD-dependent oxidoreductase [Candidatus Shapirobacteria bacterium]